MGDLTSVSDARLVTSIARYDQAALAEVYRRHGGAVYGLARRVLNEGHEAEDVTQEVFLRLWNEPDRFDPERGTLRTYLLTQTHGRAVDVIRSVTSRRRREHADADGARRVDGDLERQIWDLAVADEVQRALVTLPAEERAAIELAYFGGFTYTEVAERLQQPEGTVKSRIRNGMRRMRGALLEVGIAGAD